MKIVPSFEELPSKVQLLLEEVQDLKSIILNKIKHPKEVPKYLSIDEAVLFLSEQGFIMKKSSLYKKTAGMKVSFEKFNGKLTFNTKELLTWAESQLVTKKKIYK